MHRTYYAFLAAVILGALLPVAAYAATGTIDSIDYQSRLCSNRDCSVYSNVYWQTANGTPVTVSDTGLVGDIWSENSGWIRLDPAQGGVHNTTSGVLSGFAWGDTASWVNFSPTGAGVTIDPITGEFAGYAWVSGAGWMHFDCSLGPTACVKTTWRPTLGTSTGTSGSTSGSGHGGGGIGTTTTGTTGTATATTTGTASGTTSTTGTTGSTTSGSGTTGTGTTTTSGTLAGTSTASGTSGTTTTGSGFPVGSGTPPTAGTTAGPRTGPPGSGHSSGAQPSITENISHAVVKAATTTKQGLEALAGSPLHRFMTTTTAAVGLAELLLIPMRFWTLLFTVLGIKKRRRISGLVYDSTTKLPLDPARVVLRGAEGKELISAATDKEGLYDIEVPEAGDYTLFAEKSGYIFPSQSLVGRDHDDVYHSLYFGEYFKAAPEQILVRNIPMDPKNFDWNAFVRKEQPPTRLCMLRSKLLIGIADAVFSIGFFLSALLTIADHAWYNIAVLLLYVALFFIRTAGFKAHPFGFVIDQMTGKPLSFAILRISRADTGAEVMYRIADEMGKYYCLLPNGSYMVRIDRKLPDGSYAPAKESIPVAVTRGHLSKDFSVWFTN